MLRAEPDISAYEGLVCRTAQLFHQQLGMEKEDLCQELRVKVWKACRAYDPARSALNERRYIYGCVANFVKDLKKEAARRAARERPTGYIEDQVTAFGSLAAFEIRYLHITHDEAFRAVEDAGFVLPSTITEQEAAVLVRLFYGYSQVEIAEDLGLSGYTVQRQVSSLREKLADWRPSRAPAAVAQLPIAAVREAIAA